MCVVLIVVAKHSGSVDNHTVSPFQTTSSGYLTPVSHIPSLIGRPNVARPTSSLPGEDGPLGKCYDQVSDEDTKLVIRLVLINGMVSLRGGMPGPPFL